MRRGGELMARGWERSRRVGKGWVSFLTSASLGRREEESALFRGLLINEKKNHIGCSEIFIEY